MVGLVPGHAEAPEPTPDEALAPAHGAAGATGSCLGDQLGVSLPRELGMDVGVHVHRAFEGTWTAVYR